MEEEINWSWSGKLGWALIGVGMFGQVLLMMGLIWRLVAG